ncbi:RidA family protein [Bradyrhizobium sp. U87765 SZCCT0131]|uniref:RidA family protein n=1 Tax=unclassified Bradyrhizobium TaxID=2631580 RepID=UPI001BA4487E|nr:MULTISPECIES: Rid family hydrolase [unclassified Bradyrhizobium]MBR1217799.1 RidA family protein [Bradyrhizobium sp. U87765 SZCCT0131]MBR1261255.1 RidA family protein [Bradyrhizobium sp. U87765 SZCCT0134]MBR1303297.1 RidA family protein [Bradyrhizobium sp. U87765 SZCCT0110]MBR1318903.1 RidA family protein [Bradyrhizobium sp. U87765 SZCCT0109]MBR1347228.1 RidA family protein [Bradyrhizobium sp. U87765 SZCCT0048]
MLSYRTSDDIAAPFGNYNHAVEVPPGARVLHLAGQVGARRDGTIPDRLEEEVRLIFANLESVLKASGMALSDLVKLNYFVASTDHLATLRTVRDTILKAPYPAASLVIVKALGRPEWRIEVDGIAAKVGA